jgi:predicted nuclease of predicted toxin-antitoxin system
LFRHKSPPKVIWLTCGNTSKRRMMEILKEKLSAAMSILADSEDLVEIQ